MKYLLATLAVGITLGAFLFSASAASAQVSGGFWYPSGSYLTPVVSTWGIKLPSLTSESCLGTNSSGEFIAGTCSGGGSGVATTSLQATSPLTVTKTTSAITYAIPQATGSVNGYLDSTDWNTFNNKQGTITLTTTGTSGAATFSGNTLNIPQYAGTTYTAGNGLSLSAGAFSINDAFANIFTALQTFGNASSTLFSTKYASSTAYYGANLASCNGSSNALTWNGGKFGCNTISAGTVTSVAMTVPTGLSISGSPITTNGTLALTLASGYTIPLIASTTNWNNFYNTPSSRITAGTGLSWSGNTLNASAASAGTLSTETPSGTINGTNTIFTTTHQPALLELNGAYQTAGGVDYTLTGTGPYTETFVNAPVSGSNLTSLYGNSASINSFSSPLVDTSNVVSIPAATGSVNGYLTSTDWTTFNNKQGAITLTTTGTSGAATFSGGTLNIPQYAGATYTAAYPVTLTGSAFGLAFGTTTSNTWAGTQTFTNTISGSISGNAATVTNGLYSTGSYLNPSWLTGVPYSILTGTVPTWNQNTTGSAGSVGHSLSPDGATLTGTSFNGSATVSNWALNLAHGNTWSALQQFGNATSTLFSSHYASTTQLYVSGQTGCAQFSGGKLTGTGTNCGVGAGTVTSVAATVPTGLTVTGTPITTSGTLAFGLQTGYNIPLTASTTNWNNSYNSWNTNNANWTTAYTDRITSASSPLSITSNVLSIPAATGSANGYLSSTDWTTFNGKQGTITLTTTGTSGAATFSGGTLNIPQYAGGSGGSPGGSSGQVQYNNASAFGGASQMYITSSGTLGIGTTTAASNGLVVGANYGLFNYENKDATSTTMTVNMASSTSQLVRLGTSATTISFSHVVPGETLTLTTCSPNAVAGALTFSGVHYSGGVQPGNTTAANQCDMWYFRATQATSSVINVLTGETSGIE